MAHSYRPNSEDAIKIDRSTLVLTIDGMSWTMPAVGSTLGSALTASGSQGALGTSQTFGGSDTISVNAIESSINALATAVNTIVDTLETNGLLTPV
jgi:ApbE superfamily uncharacterized protein (UPF0280 family)